MGRAEERRARQRGGRRAAPKGRRAAAAGGRTGIRRLFTWKKILGTFFTLCLLGMGAFIVLYMLIDIPEGNADAELQSNVYEYSDGSLMARDGDRNREIVDLARVPKPVQRTFVAAENKTFYKDSGVDLKGTARGVLNTLSGKGAQGGSTITQQYVKNYYLTQEQTVSRKLKELVISLKLDREKSKDYILAGYINTSYYGRGAYGIQAAAQAYYRVDAEDLTVEQGAYLAALLQAPNQYDWAIAGDTGKKLVQERWNYVLDNMVEQKWLDAGERAGMTFPVPKEPKAAPGMEGQTGYLVEAANAAVKQQLVEQGVAEDLEQAKALLDRGGYTITLNIDKKKQKALEKAVKDRLTSKLDPKKRAVDARRPGRRRLRRPQDRQGRGAVRRRGLREALHQQRHPQGLPAGVHLQAGDPRGGRRAGRRDPGRCAHHGRHGLQRRQQATRGRGRREGRLRPAQRERHGLRRHHRPGGHEQVRQLRLRADGRRRRYDGGDEDRGRARHEREPRPVPGADPGHHGRQPDADGRRLRHPRQPRQAGHAVDREVGRAQGPHDRDARPGRPVGSQPAGRRHGHLGAHRSGRRRYGAGLRAGQPAARRRPAGRGQDRHLRRQQVGLVHRLHARPGHLGRPVRRGSEDRQAGPDVQGGRRRLPRQRRWLPGRDLGRVHLRRAGRGVRVRPGDRAGRGRGPTRSPSPSETPSQTPTEEPTTEEPTTSAPPSTTSPPPTTEPPTQTPTSPPPSQTPTTPPPPTFDLPGGPDEPQNNDRE